MTVKMIIERIIKALLKSKILQFRTNLQTLLSGVQDHQFEYVFTDENRKPSFSWTSQIFGFEKMVLFLSGNMLQFFTSGKCKFQKDVNGVIHGKTIIL